MALILIAQFLSLKIYIWINSLVQGAPCGLVVVSLPIDEKVGGSNPAGWNFSKIRSQHLGLENSKGPFWIGKNNNNNKNKETKKAYRSPCSCLLCHESYHLVSNMNMQMLFQNDLKKKIWNLKKKIFKFSKKNFFFKFFFKFFQLFLNFKIKFLNLFFHFFKNFFPTFFEI